MSYRLSKPALMRSLQTSFLPGYGIRTGTNGNPAADSQASANSCRTACIATQSKASLKVVRNPTTSSANFWRRALCRQRVALGAGLRRKQAADNADEPKSETSKSNDHWNGDLDTLTQDFLSLT
jgi:hypothetical protein